MNAVNKTHTKLSRSAALKAALAALAIPLLLPLGKPEAALADTGLPATSSYRAETQSRQTQLTAVERELREVSQQLQKSRNTMRDLSIVYNELARRTGRLNIPIEKTPKIEQSICYVLAQPDFKPAEIRAAEAGGRTVSLAGGKFSTDRGYALVNIFRELKTRASAEAAPTARLEDRRQELERQKVKLTREIGALEGGRRVKVADQLILGRWRLDTEENFSVILVVKNPHTGTYNAILEDNRLNYHRKGDTIFSVSPAEGTGDTFTFQGKEYGFTDEGMPLISNIRITVQGGSMVSITGDERLHWTKKSGVRSRMGVDTREKHDPYLDL